MEEIWFAPGVLDFGRRFHWAKPRPSETELRRAIRSMTATARRHEYRVSGSLPWSPPPFLEGCSLLVTTVSRGQDTVYVATPRRPRGPLRALAVGLDRSEPGLTRVVRVAVDDRALDRHDALHPSYFAYEHHRATGTDLVSWRITREGRIFELLFWWQPERDAGEAALNALYDAGTTIDLENGRPLAVNAVAFEHRMPRHCVLSGNRIELLEAASVSLHQATERLATPQEAFAYLVGLLPTSDALAALGQAPDSRLEWPGDRATDEER